MRFTFECPVCKKSFQVNHEELGNVKCGLCGDAPPPDIMTAYGNVGRTMSELYGCCGCGDKEKWLPKEIRR
jgi:predicted Zn finger-like uncharacterized protein